MINTKLQNIIDTKSAIGNAIVNKGGTITGETPFFNYAAQIDGISTGTPQTIFAASDGSKWALTNAVNLTNVSGNVTHDFNYWQPANNSTSDPILNIGTVGANISGNIQLVPVNQVNISQYVNMVATDTNGAKYEGFNGFDFNTNPTPTGNTTFNRWLLNNSATGTVIFANATIVNGGTFNGPNATIDISNTVRVGNTADYGGTIRSITTNNGFIYAGGDTNQTVKKFHESNLDFVGATANYGGTIQSITTNDGFIYVGGGLNGTIQKFYESNLAFVGNTANYGGDIFGISISNGFIYAAGQLGGFVNGNVKKYYESNLAFVDETANYGSWLRTLTTNNGFIYAGGSGNATANRDVKKYYESNLAFVGNTARYGGTIQAITTNNGFIYFGGGQSSLESNGVKKHYESNLAFVVNVGAGTGDIEAVTTNNGFIYATGESQKIQKFQEQSAVLENVTFYTATKIKE